MHLVPDLAAQRAQVAKSVHPCTFPPPLIYSKVDNKEWREYSWSQFSISKEQECGIYSLVAVTSRKHSLMKSKQVSNRHCVPVPISPFSCGLNNSSANTYLWKPWVNLTLESFAKASLYQERSKHGLDVFQRIKISRYEGSPGLTGAGSQKEVDLFPSGTGWQEGKLRTEDSSRGMPHTSSSLHCWEQVGRWTAFWTGACPCGIT